MNIRKLKFLSGNALKIIACITMAIDHIGFMFFPYDLIYRKIGRIAFPIFAFLLAEGCKYTKNKLKHFLTLFALTIICQVGYYLFAGDTYLCILVTLCLSQLCIFALQYFKKSLLNNDAKPHKKLLSACLFVGAIAFTAVFCRLFTVEYGFWGCMLPVFVSLFEFRNAFPVPTSTVDEKKPSVTNEKKAQIRAFIQNLDNSLTQYLCFALGLILSVLSSKTGLPQEYALFSLIPIAFYSGKRGKLNLKYFFYLFYPLHLVAIEGAYILLYFL
jgi:hypothetical protein